MTAIPSMIENTGTQNQDTKYEVTTAESPP